MILPHQIKNDLSGEIRGEVVIGRVARTLYVRVVRKDNRKYW